MSASERMDPKSGPLGNLSQVYFGSLDSVARGFEPALKGVGRWNLEFMNLITRRTQAWLDVPAALSRCKSPQDVLNEQFKFWQKAAAQYSDGSHRLAAAFGACAVIPGLNGAWVNGSGAAPARDIITFAEPKDAPAAAAAKRTDRRAA
jgi:hypothetical protein